MKHFGSLNTITVLIIDNIGLDINSTIWHYFFLILTKHIEPSSIIGLRSIYSSRYKLNLRMITKKQMNMPEYNDHSYLRTQWFLSAKDVILCSESHSTIPAILHSFSWIFQQTPIIYKFIIQVQSILI